MNEIIIKHTKTKHATEVIMDCFKQKTEITKQELQDMTGLSNRTIMNNWVPDLVRQDKLVVIKQNGKRNLIKLVGC